MNLDVTLQLQHPGWKRLLRPYCKTVRKICELTLSETPLARIKCRFEVAVVLADDAMIKTLNGDFRGVDKPTNVLSFPAEDGMKSKLSRVLKGQKEFAIGDVVLAIETLEREAKEQGKKPRDHATHLLVHGILHLLGYDHMNEKDAKIMESLEIKILKNQQINNPYL